MSRLSILCGALLLLTIGCGDPKGAAGAIGAPVQKMDPSKMNKSAKDAKIAPQDSRTMKFNPEVPDAQQKVTPVAPIEQKVQ
jgi:hypothetical protein